MVPQLFYNSIALKLSVGMVCVEMDCNLTKLANFMKMFTEFAKLLFHELGKDSFSTMFELQGYPQARFGEICARKALVTSHILFTE